MQQGTAVRVRVFERRTAGWLEGRATGQLDQSFPWLSSVLQQMLLMQSSQRDQNFVMLLPPNLEPSPHAPTTPLPSEFSSSHIIK